MKIAVLSDIHSNKYALTSTMHFLESKKIDKYIFLGDLFGYYPWAMETYNIIKPYLPISIHLLGNHDELIINPIEPEIKPEYWDVIIQNKNDLSLEAIDWLSTLIAHKKIVIGNMNFELYHGSPDNPLNGRFYPDNKNEYGWFPKENEIILMGHTHYPLLIKTTQNGILLNPGSVGQPRDGNLESSFAIINTENNSFEFYRVPYDVNKAIRELESMNWYKRAIESLKKTSK